MARRRALIPNYRLLDRGGRFYLQFWEGGKNVRISTRATDRREAEKFLAQFIAGRGSPAPPAQPTIAEILKSYMADRKDQVRGFSSMQVNAKAVTRHLGDLGPAHLTRERCRFYRSVRRVEGYEVGPPHARRRKPVMDGTILRELLMLRAALRWAEREGWISRVPYIETPSAPPPRRLWLTREEADRLIAAAVAPHIRLFLVLALHTAARAQALLNLTWPKVDLEARRIDLGPPAGGKGRAVVPINAVLFKTLREARAGATTLFVIEHGSHRVASVKTGVRAAARRAGLPWATPHVLRHTAATWMAMAGVSMTEIARFLGHSSTATTERVYAQHSPDYLERAARALEGG